MSLPPKDMADHHGWEALREALRRLPVKDNAIQLEYESIRADTWRDAAMAMAELIEWDDPEDSMAYHRYEAAKKLLDAAASLER